MRTKMILLVSSAFLALQPVHVNANESEIQLLREQIQALTIRLNAWVFKATYFINDIDLASGNSKDFECLMLDLSFKFK